MLKKSVLTIGLLVISGIAMGSTYKFDFDANRAGETIRTAAGYTSVTKDTAYDPALGYGFVTGSGSPTTGTGDARDWGAVKAPYTDLYGDVVYGVSWDIWFRVDVDPGDYTVNMAVGIPGWYSWCIVDIQDTTYQWNHNPANADSEPSPNNGTMKIIDVYNVTNGQARIRDLVAKNSSADPATTTAGEVRYGNYPYVKAYGYNNTGDYVEQGYYYEDAHRSEYLLIDGAQVSQSQLYYDSANDKYYIKVRPWKPGSQAPGYAMLEIVPEPATIGLLAIGVLGLIRRK